MYAIHTIEVFERGECPVLIQTEQLSESTNYEKVAIFITSIL